MVRTMLLVGEQRSILIVDPNAAIRRMLEVHLVGMGHSVATCRSASEAIELLNAGEFHLVVTESETPDGSGFDILRATQQHPSNHHIATIIISDRNHPERIMKALERGADDYLTKPISPAIVVARVAAVLDLQSRGLLDSRGPDVLDLPKLDRTLRETTGGTGKLNAICDALRDGLHAERASVYRYDASSNELLTVVAHGLTSEDGSPLIRMPADEGLAGACMRLGHIINIPDAQEDSRFNPRFDEQTGFRTRSVLCIPLRDDHNDIIGVAQILNHHNGTFAADSEVKAMQLAPRCALTLAEAFFEVDRELNLAATIIAQPGTATFLPTMLPSSVGMSTGILPKDRSVRAESFIGTEIGRYRVIDVLGTGSQGLVLNGLDELLDRSVAIKLLGPDSARIPMLRRQFMQEARTMAKLGHPNTVAIHDVGDHDGALYLVMEHCTGGTSFTLIKATGPLELTLATRILRDACKGLNAAHQRGMIHRDIKPDNILIDESGMAKLSDFGLVLAPNTTDIAGTNHIIGTPHYMSPEQCSGGLVDHRSDLYAMGATWFHLITGQPPYHGSSDVREVLRHHRESPVPDPRGVIPDLPEDVASIISTAMAKKPSDRYQNASELLRDLDALLTSISPAT
ncbi:MAG: protein kinase [Phycisphaerae bacterium]|jgi:CheY-like chemotaxis protein|nr:protein kinase [Phycisphaerae bacterium]MBT5658345.1 protein kinase [Phycisphaerae bacterium]